jgi:hypothetical protein
MSESGGYLREFKRVGEFFVCLRCGALVTDEDLPDYDDAREKHYEWHMKPR